MDQRLAKAIEIKTVLRDLNIRDDYVDLSFNAEMYQSPIQPQENQEQLSTFYYLRLEQYDGEMAWSSPIWVN